MTANDVTNHPHVDAALETEVLVGLVVTSAVAPPDFAEFFVVKIVLFAAPKEELLVGVASFEESGVSGAASDVETPTWGGVDSRANVLTRPLFVVVLVVNVFSPSKLSLLTPPEDEAGFNVIFPSRPRFLVSFKESSFS